MLPSQLAEGQEITLTRGNITIHFIHEYGKLEASIAPTAQGHNEAEYQARVINVYFKTPAEYDGFYLGTADSVTRDSKPRLVTSCVGPTGPQ